MPSRRFQFTATFVSSALLLMANASCGVFPNNSALSETAEDPEQPTTQSDDTGRCTGSEEGMYNCNVDEMFGNPDDPNDPNDPNDPGTGDPNDPGTGTTPGGDPNDPGGDCPEDGCPGADPGDPGTGTTPGGDPNDPNDPSDPACVNEAFAPATAEADLLLIVDRSGSMDEYPPNATATKWQQIRSVVTTVTAELGDELGFGMMFYPAGNTEALVCVEGDVVVDIADNNGPSIAAAFASTIPGGGTPTAATLVAANTYLRGLQSTRPQAVVLATDGAPNCNPGNDPATCTCSQTNNCGIALACLDDNAAVQAVERMAAFGFATFVIGIPGAELFARVLDDMAVAGGTAVAGTHKYYQANSASAIEQALRSIGQRVTSCRFELQQDPYLPTLGVSVNGAPASRDTSRNNGWDYVGARTIEFFGTACTQLVNSAATVEVEYCTVQGG